MALGPLVLDATLAGHRIADEIIKFLTGEEGVSTSRILFARRQGRGREFYSTDPDGADLAQLTSVNFPSPGFGSFEATDDITVTTNPLERLPNQYREFREYASDDEDRRYILFFRYNRTA